MKTLPSRLLVITDRHQARHPLEDIAEAVAQAGGRWLLFRDKDLETAARRALAGRLAALAHRHGMHLSVSRDVGVAAEHGASVHLPSQHLEPGRMKAAAVARLALAPGALVGVSAHAPGDIARAAAMGADYVTLSPVFATASKPGYGPALGLPALEQAARAGTAAGVAVLALGGVTAANARTCLDAGAAGVAVMGEIMRAEDPGGSAAGLLAALASRPA